jgi:radical SAM superfamily enzyme
LKDAGLTAHIGLESGSDMLMRYIKRRYICETYQYGRKIKAGIELSEYVVLGLGRKKWWCTMETADTLNKINPDFIRFRTIRSRICPL